MGRHQRNSQGEGRSTRRGPGDSNFASGVFEAADLGCGFSPGKAALRYTFLCRVEVKLLVRRALVPGFRSGAQPCLNHAAEIQTSHP
jgi:hypothetical protein